MKKKYLIEYNSNNSGGNWWLKDKDWKNLENNGWLVVWASKSFDYKDGNYQYDKNGLPKLIDKPNDYSNKEKGEYRKLGALADNAFKRFDTITEALIEFEKITKENISDEGCHCCGAPHRFNWEDVNGNRDYCSGEDCLKYLYPDKKIPKSIRDCIDKSK